MYVYCLFRLLDKIWGCVPFPGIIKRGEMITKMITSNDNIKNK
jgi:hypothetical protein